MSVRLSTGLATVVAVASIAGFAQAHAHLVTAVPAVDATAAAPSEIRINFSEEVIAKFSGVVIKDAKGHGVPVGKSEVDPKDHRIMTVPINAKLAPGAYDVMWHAVSEDTHRKEGAYRFSVQ